MSNDTTNEVKKPQPVEKFGTFLGVFTPSVLNIPGLIMYLRFGWVVGNVGLPVALFIVLLASSITFITALSASAVATNMHVTVFLFGTMIAALASRPVSSGQVCELFCAALLARMVGEVERDAGRFARGS